MIEEKRKYPRLSLEIEDGYFGNFQLPNGEMLAVPILNLSAGGLNIAVPQINASKIKSGDILLLKNIVGGRSLDFIADINAEVRWIKKLDHPGYLAAGCFLQSLSEKATDQLSKFVNSERMSRGQYD